MTDVAKAGHAAPKKGKDPDTRRSTLYLVRETVGGSLREVLNLRYAEDHDFEIRDVSIGSTYGLLYTGVINPDRPPDWADVVCRLTGVAPAVENRTAAGVLLVPVEGRIFALTYGMGHLLLDQGHVEAGFGFGFALRMLKPDAIRQVTHSVMDPRGRTDRNSVSQDQPIHGFGIEEYGEIVSRVAGRLGPTSLTLGRRKRQAVQISGTDALKVHLGSDPEDLLADLAEIKRIMTEESPDPQFDAIARVRPLKANDERLPDLERRLDVLLGDPSSGRIAVTVPAHLLDEEGSVTSFWVKIGRRRELVDELELGHILDKTRDMADGDRFRALSKGHIQMCRDAEGADVASGQVSAHRWLTAEISLGTSRFFYYDGKWYEVGDRHLDTIHEQVRSLLEADAGLSLVDWTPDLEDEEAYNKKAAGEGYVCLDRDLIRTTQHPRGIEACDLLGPDCELVHVKRAKSTAPLNHLFAQGRNSADALRMDSTARRILIDKVRGLDPGHPIQDDFVPKKVIYAISLESGKPLSVDNLFTFAQVSLLQATVALRNLGIEVNVINIPTIRPPRPSSGRRSARAGK